MTIRLMRTLSALLLYSGLVMGAQEPGLALHETSEPDLYSTVEPVLAERGFACPVLLRGTNAATWLTCDRFRDPLQFDRVLVCIGGSDEVTVQIIPYRFALSDWTAPRAVQFYQCTFGFGQRSDEFLGARLWLPGPVQGFGIFPWHLRGTNDVGRTAEAGLRERAFQLVGYAMNEESVETDKGLTVRLSGYRYVGDPVSPEGLEAATLGRAIQERLLTHHGAAGGEGPR